MVNKHFLFHSFLALLFDILKTWRIYKQYEGITFDFMTSEKNKFVHICIDKLNLHRVDNNNWKRSLLININSLCSNVYITIRNKRELLCQCVKHCTYICFFSQTGNVRTVVFPVVYLNEVLHTHNCILIYTYQHLLACRWHTFISNSTF